MQSTNLTPWQTEPCPPWCACSDLHWQDTSAEDRSHYSRHAQVDLHTMDMIPITGTHHELDHASLWIEQHYREVAPRIGVGHNDGAGMWFTVGEAILLIDELQRLVDIAEGHAEAG